MSSDRKVILETIGLTKHYGGVEALNDADFKMYADEHIAIVGDNGAGKSTFVRNITGVEQRTSGDVVFDGESVNFRAPLLLLLHGWCKLLLGDEETTKFAPLLRKAFT